MEELNEKNRENESLKSRILTFRQQLRFKVARLRQYEEILAAKPFVAPTDKDGVPGYVEYEVYASEISQKEKEIVQLKRKIEDRDKYIQEQKIKINTLESRWDDLKKSAKKRKESIESSN